MSVFFFGSESSRSDHDDGEDVVISVYEEHDEQISKGTLVVEKPWQSLPPANIIIDIDDDLGATTGHLLKNLLDNLWHATEDHCGVRNCKKVTEDMYFCEACREYYHLQCVDDSCPTKGDHYLCPKHRSSTVSTKMASVGNRTVSLPLRLRKSL